MGAKESKEERGDVWGLVLRDVWGLVLRDVWGLVLKGFLRGVRAARSLRRASGASLRRDLWHLCIPNIMWGTLFPHPVRGITSTSSNDDDNNNYYYYY